MVALIRRLKSYKARFHKWRYDYGVDRAHRRSIEQHPEEYKSIGAFLDAYRSGGGLNHRFQGYKLYQLRKLLDRVKPTMILELGSGSSTAIFAEYVRQASTPSFVCSVDDDERWLEHSKNIAWGDKFYSGFAEFIHAPRIVDALTDPPISKYDIALEAKYDFIFIDGPPMRAGNIKNKSMVNSNIFDLIGRVFPTTIVVDVRRPTVNEIKKRLSDQYTCKTSDIISGTANRLDYRYFTIFQRIE